MGWEEYSPLIHGASRRGSDLEIEQRRIYGRISPVEGAEGRVDGTMPASGATLTLEVAMHSLS